MTDGGLHWAALPDQPPSTPTPTPAERQAQRLAGAQWTAKALQGLLNRVDPPSSANPASPAEIAQILGRRGEAAGSLPMFTHMALGAIEAKYRRAGQSPLADLLLTLRAQAWRDTLQQAGLGQATPSEEREALQHRCRQVLPTLWARRMRVHASRVDHGDRDLHLAVASTGALPWALRSWLCQQPDGRLRWTTAGVARLRFVITCWRGYALCTDPATGCTIGAEAFPLSPELAASPPPAARTAW